MTEFEHFTCKIIVVGDFAVGKTSFIKRYLTESFTFDYKPTVGVDIFTKQVILRENKIVFQFNFWDIAGQELFQQIRKKFYEGADAAFLIYDCTRPETFQNIPKWDIEIPSNIKYSKYIL